MNAFRLSSIVVRPAPWFAPLTAWLTFMVAFPIVDFVTRGQLYPWLATVNVLLQGGAVMAALWNMWPRARVLRLAAIVLPLTWLAEFIGHTTGLPFGEYDYAPLLQPQLFGVPVLIPIAWVMMLPPAWAVASALISPQHRFAFAIVAAFAFTAWDLFLDPQMVARGLWSWQQPGEYFGIPFVNFGGWLLTSGLITFLVHPHEIQAAAKPLALIYTLTWILQTIGLGLFWGQSGPALFGFLGMGMFVVMFWQRERLKIAS
ncbi:MAG: carotenoid biosynthesis protein [Anaerolineales bacterium]